MDYKKVLTELGLYHINLEENTPQKPPHNFNPYYWWRRFGTHETLKASSHVLEKAKNGDFDASPYWKQIRYEYYYLVKDVLELRKKIGYVDKIQERDLVLSYNKRIKKLTEDALADEEARMKDFYASLVRNYGGDKKKAEKYIQKYAKGTFEECILEYKNWLQHDEKMDLVR